MVRCTCRTDMVQHLRAEETAVAMACWGVFAAGTGRADMSDTDWMREMEARDDFTGTLCRFNRLIEHYAGETDRGAAVLAAGFADRELCQQLRRFMVDDDRVKQLLREGGPVGSFATRIDLALGLGLVSDREAKEWHIVKTIRNRFAHEVALLTFETQEIRDRCANLRVMQLDPASWNHMFGGLPNARQAYLWTIACLLGVLAGRVDKAGRLRPLGGPRASDPE